MNSNKITQLPKPPRDASGDFCPEEAIEKVADLFLVRERDGRTIERQLGIRRNLFERALRHAFNRQRDPHGPKAMGRAMSATGGLSLIRKVG